jgi:hypothetical protein
MARSSNSARLKGRKVVADDADMIDLRMDKLVSKVHAKQNQPAIQTLNLARADYT